MTDGINAALSSMRIKRVEKKISELEHKFLTTPTTELKTELHTQYDVYCNLHHGNSNHDSKKQLISGNRELIDSYFSKKISIEEFHNGYKKL